MTRGIVLAWTRVHRAPAGHTPPFVLACIDTAEDARLAVGDEELSIGETVEVESSAGRWRFRRNG